MNIKTKKVDMAEIDLPCYECPHSDQTCGSISCGLEGRAVHLLESCPLGHDL